MGYTHLREPNPKQKKTIKFRSCIPEPLFPLPKDPPVYCVSYLHDGSRKSKHKRRLVNAQIKHTSFLTTLKNCIISFRMSRKNRRKHRRKHCSDNAEKLLSSLKNDIHMISRQEKFVAANPDCIESSDPFFLFSAMLCKINKLEDIIIKATNCEKQMTKRKELLVTAKCIKKSLLDQMHCEKTILKEKHLKLCHIIRCLDTFERQIRCMTRAAKYRCGSTKKKQCSPVESKCYVCDCSDKSKCSPNCKEKSVQAAEAVEQSIYIPSDSPEPCITTDSPCVKENNPNSDCCEEQTNKYDITGMNLTYTKSCLQTDSKGNTKETVQDQMLCTMNENENCCVSFVKDGKNCNVDTSGNAELKCKMDNISKLWLESARELIDAFCNCS